MKMHSFKDGYTRARRARNDIADGHVVGFLRYTDGGSCLTLEDENGRTWHINFCQGETERLFGKPIGEL